MSATVVHMVGTLVLGLISRSHDKRLQQRTPWRWPMLFDRPSSVHGEFVRSAGLSRQADRALDVGCGAGLSTAALVPLARHVVGLEPIPAMLAHRRTVALQAQFVIAQAERVCCLRTRCSTWSRRRAR